MNNQQIMKALQGRLYHNNIYFLGCLPADDVAKLNLRSESDKPIVFIANVLGASQASKMGHWVVFYVSDKCIYFFDTYALTPSLYSKYFRSFLNKHKDYPVFKLAAILQSDKTLVWGVYCIQFVYLCNKIGLERTSQFLKDNYDLGNFLKNDRKVLTYAYRMFKMPPCIKTFCQSSQGLTYKHCISKICG